MRNNDKPVMVKASIGDMMLSKLVQKDKAKSKRMRQFVDVQLHVGNPCAPVEKKRA